MGSFLLQPAKVFRTRLVPDTSREVEEYAFRELVELLAPERDPLSRGRLGKLTLGCFVGVSRNSRNPKRLNTFLLLTRGPGDIDHVLLKDPTFPDRIVRVYRVEQTGYTGVVGEAKNLPRDREIPHNV